MSALATRYSKSTRSCWNWPEESLILGKLVMEFPAFASFPWVNRRQRAASTSVPQLWRNHDANAAAQDPALAAHDPYAFRIGAKPAFAT